MSLRAGVSRQRFRAALLALAVLLALVEAPRAAVACASAPPRGSEVGVTDEEAVIVWDAASKTEHFIRKASFVSTAKSFGFLVPTPSLPELGELPRTILADIDQQLTPRTEYVDDPARWQLTSLFMLLLAGDAKSSADTATSASARGGVEVVGTSNVAGMDATILKATDSDALARWLEKHGFDRSKALDEWLVQYVQNGWFITAFVVDSPTASKATNVELAPRLVRMSFHADQPFYPYREPAPEPAKEGAPKATAPRQLRVHVLSDARMGATTNGAPWSAETTSAMPIRVPPELDALAGGHVFATTFVDRSSPRIGTDEVTFAVSADAAEVRPPPNIVRVPHYVRLPIEVFVLGGGLIGALAYAFLKRRSA